MVRQTQVPDIPAGLHVGGNWFMSPVRICQAAIGKFRQLVRRITVILHEKNENACESASTSEHFSQSGI